MSIQYLIVMIIILAAAGYAGTTLWRRSRSFSKKPGCGTDCGCDSGHEPPR